MWAVGASRRPELAFAHVRPTIGSRATARVAPTVLVFRHILPLSEKLV